MFCMILKHRSWEPEVEVIHSVTDVVHYVGTEATACVHSSDEWVGQQDYLCQLYIH